MSSLTMPPDVRETFLAELHVGVLTIARPDGRAPLASPVWYWYDRGGDVLISVAATSEKARLAAAAGVASFTVQQESLPYRFATVEGPITVTPTDPDLLQRIVERYLPPEQVEAYLSASDGSTSVTLRLAIEQWRTNDYSRLER